jgi:hypothetical protein
MHHPFKTRQVVGKAQGEGVSGKEGPTSWGVAKGVGSYF